MDWRWKTLVAKVDPAQLRASYVEFLFPRLETGLMHANTTEKMCNTWMSLIIRTFCETQWNGLRHSINNMAFCVLADPRLVAAFSYRAATELVCSLNSTNSAAGSSTMARFCASRIHRMLDRCCENLEQEKKVS